MQPASDGYRRLMEQVVAGRGLSGLARAFAMMAGCDGVIADEAVEPIQAFDGTGERLDRTESRLPDGLGERLIARLRDAYRGLDSQELLAPPVVALEHEGYAYIVSAVLLPDRWAGYVWARHAAVSEGADEQLTALVREAASACSVELVRLRAILEGEQRVRNSFLEDLLGGRVGSVSATRRRARFLGYELQGAQTVFVLDLDDFREYVAVRGLEEPEVQLLKDRLRQATEDWIDTAWPSASMVWEHSDALIVLTPAAESDRAALLHRVEALRGHVERRLAGPTISAGLGEPREDVTELQESFAEAEHAARIGAAVFGPGATTAYRDLGVYRLLFHLRDEPELIAFCNETIGRLEAYDARHDGRLIETIQTYLDLQGNVTRAAQALHLHRNGLLYRLNRIETLAGISLDDASDRLALQLALLARPILKKRPPARSAALGDALKEPSARESA